jgi:glycine cleavage system H protein
MEGFQYIDMFSTKGVEYIAVIVFLIGLVFFWRWLNRPVAAALSDQVSQSKVSLVDWFQMANDYFYHQGHSWATPEPDNIARVGIDDFAQKLLGKAEHIQVPKVGSRIEQGSESIEFRIKNKSFQILAPVGGEVVAVNNRVIENPELLNQDPYNAGWLLKVRSPRLKQNLKNLLSGNLARAWLEDTVDSLSRLITRNYGVVLQDGGTISSGFVRDLSSENWDEIARHYLLSDDKNS